MSTRLLYPGRTATAMVLLLACALTAQGASNPAGPDYGPLGKGTVRMSFLQAATGDVVLELTTDLAQVVGAVVEAEGKNLAAIVSGGAEGQARSVLARVEAETRVEIGVPTLAGQKPQIVLSSDLAGVHQIRLTLIGRDGATYPLVFQSDDFRGMKITSSFAGTGGTCHTITIRCSSGCTKTETCCSLLSCTTCRTCEILCGQSCLPSPTDE